MSKPFSIQAWSNGEKVYTRIGQTVRIICTDAKIYVTPIIALVKDELSNQEILCRYTYNGTCTSVDTSHIQQGQDERYHYDLVIVDNCDYSPFETVDEFLLAQKEHGCRIISLLEPTKYIESSINFKKEVILDSGETVSFRTLFEKYRWSDGSLCGKILIEKD